MDMQSNWIRLSIHNFLDRMLFIIKVYPKSIVHIECFACIIKVPKEQTITYVLRIA